MDSFTATNAGFVSDNINVEADNVAGHDINIEYNYVNEVISAFADINTNAYKENLFPSPVFTTTLAERVKDKRLLVIAGGPGFDKSTFVRHLAAIIAEDLPGIKVKEWRNTETNNDVLKEIQEEKPALLIINSAVPQQIRFNLLQLASTARQIGHYILLTTEMTAEAWQQPEAVKELYWFEVPSTGLFKKEQLITLFLLKLDHNKKLLNIENRSTLLATTPIAGKHSPASIAANFETPDQIDFFFVLLETDTTENIEQKISAVISSITDNSETLVTKWYKTLSPLEKLIALGAAMLDGLFDDQFFAVMQKVVEEFWHYRHKQLQSLDYCDLDFLLGFFKFEQFDDGRTILIGKFPNQRAEIIRAAWQGHKRHILSAFFMITNLAGSSSSSRRRAVHPDISGTRERGMRLRTVAAETISDIGIVSLQTAEPKLLELAAANDETTGRVTAKAMARWRTFSKEDQMFSTLTRWKENKSTSIKATVILTLRYAAEYDSPGFLDRRIIDILKDLAGDESVHGPMKDLLTRLITHHANQLKDDIANHFAIHEIYSDTIAAAFVNLYKDQPVIVKQLLEEWLNICFKENSRDNRRNKLTFRDNLLVLILKVYQSIPYQGENDVIQISYVWNILHQLHDNEQRKIMRSFVLQTAAFLISSQPEQAIKYIEPIFRKIGLEERLALIGAIGRLYLHQRMQLPNGEYVIVVHENQYPVWWRTARPSTVIEMILFGWLQGNNSFAREIATLSFMEFARVLDYEETRLIPQAVAEAMKREQENIMRQQKQEYQQAIESTVIYPFMPQLSFWTRIKIFFWLLFKTPDEKFVMKELMRTLLMYKQTNPALLGIIIARWRSHQQERIRKLAWWVEKLKTL
jgi:hypothetical protein